LVPKPLILSGIREFQESNDGKTPRDVTVDKTAESLKEFLP